MTTFDIFEGEVTRTTEMAILLRTPDGDGVWIPRSVVNDGDDYEEGDEDPQVATWWLEREGWA